MSIACGGDTKQAQFQGHLEQLVRQPELLTFLVMVPESATVRVLQSLFEYRSPFDLESIKWDGEIFALMGKRVQGHLPTIVRASPKWFECCRM